MANDKLDLAALKAILQEIAPALSEVVVYIHKAISETSTWGKEIAQAEESLKTLNDKLATQEKNQNALSQSLLKSGNIVEDTVAHFAKMGEQAPAIAELKDQIAAATQKLAEAKEKSEEAKHGLDGLGAVGIVVKGAMQELGKELANQGPIATFNKIGLAVSQAKTEIGLIVDVARFGTDAVKGLGAAFNQETETLETMNTELATTDSALSEVKDESENAGQGMQEMGNKGETLKGIMVGVGATIKATVGVFVGILGVVKSVATSIGDLVFSNASAADQLAELSQQTGISTEKLQEMEFTSTQLGVSLDTFTGSQSNLLTSMQAAQSGAEEQAKAFSSLGVNVLDTNGQMRDSQSVFGETLDALQAIQDPTERNAKAMEIFGKSAQELNPLIEAGSAGLAGYAQQAHDMGAVVDGEGVQALSAFQGQFDGIKLGLQGVGATIATAFLPAFAGIATEAEGHLKDLAQVVNGSDGDLGQMAEGIGQWFAQAANDIAATAPQMLQAAADTIKAILQGLTAALPSLVTAATGIIDSLVSFLGQSLPVLIDAGIRIVLALVNAILPQLPHLVDVALEAILALANGLTAALPALLPTVATVIVKIIETLIDNLPQLIEAGLMLLTALAAGLVAALPILITAIPTLYKSLLDGLLAASPQLAEVAGQLIGVLAVGIVSAIPLILNALIQVYQTLFATLSSEEFKQQIAAAGSKLIDGLWLGIQSGWGTLTTAFLDLFKVLTQAGQIFQDVSGLGGQIIQQLIAALLAGVANMAASALTLLQSFIGGFVTSLFMLPLLGLTILGQLVTSLLTGVLGMATSAFTLLQGFINGFINNFFMLPILGGMMIGELVTSLLIGVVRMATSALTLLQSFFDGLVANLVILAAIGGMVVNAIDGAITNELKRLEDLGKNLIGGLWQGINDRWTQLMEDLQKLIDQLPQALQDALGINSPSKVGIELGTFFSAGFGIGLLDEMARVQRKLQTTMGEFGPDLATAGAGVVAASTTQVTNDNFGFNNYGNVYLTGPQTPGNISARIKAKRF